MFLKFQRSAPASTAFQQSNGISTYRLHVQMFILVTVLVKPVQIASLLGQIVTVTCCFNMAVSFTDEQTQN